jgi:transcriptional regulator with XRE-family HTH domain
MAEPNILGERLLLSRRRARLTQAQLGTQVGLTGSSIARLEQGRIQEIRTGSLERIARALGVSADYLLGLTDDPHPAPRSTRPPARGETEKEETPAMSGSFATASLMTGSEASV